MGKFISFEGGEGSGKTTVIKELQVYLESQGYQVITTREPGGIKIAESIRSILLDVDNQEMDPLTEVMLFAAARREHLVQRIIPNLKNNKIVLCDRFIDSSLAYQSTARGIDYDLVYNINEIAIDGYLPDLTIFVDCPPEIGLKRIKDADLREVNRLDLEELSFHTKVYEAYQELLKKFPERIKRVDGTKDITDVVRDSYLLLEEFLNEN